MMAQILIIVYRTLVMPFFVIIGLPLLSLFNAKFRRGIAMRMKRVEWPEFNHQPIWIHAASGEFEYAKPLIRDLKKNHPNRPIVVTYFSPSFAGQIAKTPDIDFSIPLPLDLPGPMSTFFRRINPKLLLIARTDLWPEVLYQCQQRKVPVILFSARQTQVHFWKRWFVRWMYSFLSEIYCVSAEDLREFSRLKISPPVHVVGDTRYDQVRYRLDHPKPLNDDLRPSTATLIAGSTWEADESVLIEGTKSLLHLKQLRLILVPHEPTREHLSEIESKLKSAGLSSERYSTSETWSSDVLIVDQIGILAELYTWAHFAFVGGSFRQGVHSVMEPLAAGLPTLIGPRHQNNREALEFQKLDFEGIKLVTAVKNASELESHLKHLLAMQASLPEVQNHILQEVSARTGATARISESIRSF